MFLTRKKNRKSVQNLSHVSCTTAAAGNLNPISVVQIVAGDEVSFDPSVFVQAFPMKAPLVNGYQVCLEYFFVPDRLYNLNLNNICQMWKRPLRRGSTSVFANEK